MGGAQIKERTEDGTKWVIRWPRKAGHQSLLSVTIDRVWESRWRGMSVGGVKYVSKQVKSLSRAGAQGLPLNGILWPNIC